MVRPPGSLQHRLARPVGQADGQAFQPAQAENEAEAYAALQRDRQQRQSVIEAQLKERRVLQSDIRNLRQRHAVLIAELHKDRERYQHMTVQAPDSRSTQKVTMQRVANVPKGGVVLRDQFKKASETHCLDDRLRHLRHGLDKRRFLANKGPE